MAIIRDSRVTDHPQSGWLGFFRHRREKTPAWKHPTKNTISIVNIKTLDVCINYLLWWVNDHCVRSTGWLQLFCIAKRRMARIPLSFNGCVSPVSMRIAPVCKPTDKVPQKMKNKSIPPLNKIALISTPWPLYSRPSIQLGTLKAFLQARTSDLQVDVFHFYLSLAEAIGYRLYHEISERTWLAESIYAALLYPKRIKKAADLFRKESAGNLILRQVRFKTLTARVKKATAAFINRQNWGAFGLLGFSISFCQLTSALYVIEGSGSLSQNPFFDIPSWFT